MRTRKEYPTLEIIEDAKHQKVARLGFASNVTEVALLGHYDRLTDLGAVRLKEMDEAGIDMEVLSLSAPGCEQFEAKDGTVLARKTNDELSIAIRK